MSRNKIIKNTSYLTIAFIVQKLLALGYFIVIARLLGAENVGDYTVALSFTMVFGIFVDLGTSPVLTREIAQDESKISQHLSALFSTKLLLSVVVYACILIAVQFLNYSTELTHLIYISGFVMIADTFSLSIYSALRGLQNLKAESIGILINQTVAMTCGIFALFTIAKSPFVLIVAFLLGSIANLLFAIYVLIKRYQVKVKFHLEKEYLRHLYYLSIPFGLSGVFTRVYSYIDSIILQKFLGSASVGLYAVAYKIPFALQFIPIAFSASIYPAMSAYYKKDQEKLEQTWFVSTLYLMIFALPMLWGIYTLSDIVIQQFYGAEYLASIPILKTLIFGLFFIFVNFPLGSLLAATNKQSVNTILIGITMIINVISNIILIRQFGVIGAAYAFLISHGFLFISSLIYSAKVISIQTKKFAIIIPKLLLSTYIMGLAVRFSLNYMHWVVTIFVGALSYAGFILLLQVVTVNDIKKILKLSK